MALGGRLADALKTGRVVAFTGDLGAGKTAFVSGMARALLLLLCILASLMGLVLIYSGTRYR